MTKKMARMAATILVLLYAQKASLSIAYFNYPDPLADFAPKNNRVQSPAIKKNVPQATSESRYIILKEITVLATKYYSPSKNQSRYMHKTYQKEVQVNGKGKETAYGTKPRIGIIATDPKVFPRGTLLLVKDPTTGLEKILKADDKGSAIIGNRIDIYAGFGMKGLLACEKFESKKIVAKVIKLTDKKVRT